VHRPLFKESALLDLLARARRSFTDRSRFSREAIVFGTALLLGLVGVPLAIWFVGNRILGPYVHGTNTHAGPMALLGDFYAGLGSGFVSYWIVALGPAVIILFVRIAWALIKSNPHPERAVAKDRRSSPS
jgi:hypothetical protein